MLANSHVANLNFRIANLLSPTSLPEEFQTAIAAAATPAKKPRDPVKEIRQCLDRGDTMKAFALGYALLATGQSTPWLLFVMGGLLYQQGEVFRARAIFRNFDSDEPACRDTFFSSEVHRAFYESAAFNNEKIAALLRPDAFWGPYDSPGLTEKRIGSFLEDVFSRYESGAAPAWQPASSAFYPPEALPSSPRILLCMAHYLDCSEHCPPFQAATILKASAQKAGICAFHAGDRLLYDLGEDHGIPYLDGRPYRKSPALRDQEIQHLEKRLQQFKPDVLVVDISFEPTSNTLNPEHLLRFKHDYGISIAGVLFDDYFGYPFDYTVWEDAVDSIATCDIFNSKCNYSKNFQKYFPLMPMGKDDVDTCEEKTSDFVFCGQTNRYRGVWLNGMLCSGLSCEISTSHQHAESKFHNYADYLKLYACGKTTFNTGYFQPNVTILTGRASEAILTRCLLMEEEGSYLSAFFQPYLHYIPVRTVHELVHFARFFCRHEKWRKLIVEAAYALHRECYSGAKFWNRLLGQTLRPDLTPQRKPRIF